QADANATLIFTFVGMKTREIALNGLTNVNVEMEMDAEQMDEVIVYGYGSGQRVGSVVGSVSTVDAVKLASRPASNVSDALQGQIAGMQVFHSSGEPSDNTSIRIRGINSLNAGTAPLYLLDGIPVPASTFSTLNSNDIENISVLKDAASTAIYGSRAANGVVFITTKKGSRSTQGQVVINAQYGWSFLTQNNFDLMNSEQLFRFEEMCFPQLVNDQEYQANKEFVLSNGINFDWEKYMFKDSAPTYSLSAAVSGGSEDTRYHLSLGYLNEDGTAPRSGAERYTLRLNLDSDVKKWLKMGANVTLSYQKAETSVTGWYTNTPVMVVFSERPYNVPYELIDNDGKISYGKELDRLPWSGGINMKHWFQKNPMHRDRIALTASTFEQITPIKGLVLKAIQAVDGIDQRQTNKRLPSYIGNLGSGTTTEYFSRYYTLTATNTADYTYSLNGIHNFSVLLGQEAIVNQSTGFGASVPGMTDDRLTLLPAGNVNSITLPSGSVYKEEYVFNSYFGRLSYDYNQTYYLSASLRRDGSSRFGESVRYANFWSVGAMWDAKKAFFLSDIDAVNSLRLKANYGVTGNSSIGNYLALGTLGTGPQYNNQSGLGIAAPGNPDLTWEEVASFNLGAEGRLFDRVDFNAEFYNKITSNMLMEVPWSATTGFGSGWGNVGKMRNRGFELTLGVDILNDNDFQWRISGNINYNKNTMLELYNGIDRYVNGTTGLEYVVGEPVGGFSVVERVGVDPMDGTLVWRTKEGQLTKVYSDDDAVFNGMNMYADWSGGFSTSFSWNGLSLAADFSFVGKRYMWLNEKYYTMNSNNAGQSNFETKMLEMWTQPGQITDVPKFGTPFYFDTSVYENASFIRMKNLSLSYTLPRKWLQKTGIMEGARVYATGRNRLTFTDFHGYDPEFDNNGTAGTYPNSRQISMGVELTF
ncbi:MAG: SusC/RagA family TonB-linked outer membrane protein, partial [Culturomica sp.]|nr:SusC/RagA family TonB-linked outer membrane protein [Culturomica sp.]